ncbi:hypothetical protein [Natronorubrum aibiense]|nr:hypothetical protein [Natronorubrum aibiense]
MQADSTGGAGDSGDRRNGRVIAGDENNVWAANRDVDTSPAGRD